MIISKTSCSDNVPPTNTQKSPKKLIQKTLDAYENKKVSLFSCVDETTKISNEAATTVVIDVDKLDKDVEEVDMNKNRVYIDEGKVGSYINKGDKLDEKEPVAQDKLRESDLDEILPENVNISSDESLPRLDELQTDIKTQQLELSLLSRLKKREILDEESLVITAKDITDNEIDAKEISMSLFQAINETWELELSQDPHVPTPPHESITDIDLSLDFNIFSQKETAALNDSIPDIDQVIDANFFSEKENTAPKERSVLSVLQGKNDIVSGDNMFQKLAEKEKHSESEDDIPDFTLEDVTDNDLPPNKHISDEDQIITNPKSTSRKCLSRQQKLTNDESLFVPKNSSTPLAPPVKADALPADVSQKALNFTSTSQQVDEVSPLIVGKRKRRCNILATQDAKDSTRKKSKTHLFDGQKSKKCKFIDDEAEVEDSDTEDDTEDEEDCITASLAEFVDHSNSIWDRDMAMYMQDLNCAKKENVVRTVGEDFNACNEIEPFTQDDYYDIDSSFICGDEDLSQIDCLEETAVFTQQLRSCTRTPKAIIPTQRPGDLPMYSPVRGQPYIRKKRVLEFLGSQTPEKSDGGDFSKDRNSESMKSLKPLQNSYQCCSNPSKSQDSTSPKACADDSTFDIDIENLLNDETADIQGKHGI